MTRFGLQIPNFTYDVDDAELFGRVIELARAAEESDFSSVWVMDHFYQLPGLGGPSNPMLEAYTTLGALAGATNVVELGTLVTGVTYRNPAMLAKQVTTLDVISGGRAICGLGAAWYDVEHDGLGFAFPPVAERMDRLEEAVQICRLMFTEERPTFEGKHYRIREALNLPRPVRPGGPPIMIGGGGERRTLKIAAKYADAVNWFGDPETIAHKLDVLRAHCADVGRDVGEIEITRLGTMYLTDSEAETERYREVIAKNAGEHAARVALVGGESEVLDRIAALAESGVQTFLVNMPLSDPDHVRRAGTFLSKHF